MTPNTAIFDMDGLLIDSEPLWYRAAQSVLAAQGIPIDDRAYARTVGLRTREFLEFWSRLYAIDPALLPSLENEITEQVIDLVRTEGELMPGVQSAIDYFKGEGYRIGLATSSPLTLVDAMIERTGLQDVFEEISSASLLPYGKPHPQVYLNCATALQRHPHECICLEDSYNGMIAAKAARMHCIVVPEPGQRHLLKWQAADLVLTTLADVPLHLPLQAV